MSSIIRKVQYFPEFPKKRRHFTTIVTFLRLEMELIKDIPMAESEFNILSKILEPSDSPPLETLSQSAATILSNLAIEKVKQIVHFFW